MPLTREPVVAVGDTRDKLSLALCLSLCMVGESFLWDRSKTEMVFSSPPFVAQFSAVSPELVGISIFGR
jgi:hypothetical protein